MTKNFLALFFIIASSGSLFGASYQEFRPSWEQQEVVYPLYTAEQPNPLFVAPYYDGVDIEFVIEQMAWNCPPALFFQPNNIGQTAIHYALCKSNTRLDIALALFRNVRQQDQSHVLGLQDGKGNVILLRALSAINNCIENHADASAAITFVQTIAPLNANHFDIRNGIFDSITQAWRPGITPREYFHKYLAHIDACQELSTLFFQPPAYGEERPTSATSDKPPVSESESSVISVTKDLEKLSVTPPDSDQASQHSASSIKSISTPEAQTPGSVQEAPTPGKAEEAPDFAAPSLKIAQVVKLKPYASVAAIPVETKSPAKTSLQSSQPKVLALAIPAASSSKKKQLNKKTPTKAVHQMTLAEEQDADRLLEQQQEQERQEKAKALAAQAEALKSKGASVASNAQTDQASAKHSSSKKKRKPAGGDRPVETQKQEKVVHDKLVEELATLLASLKWDKNKLLITDEEYGRFGNLIISIQSKMDDKKSILLRDLDKASGKKLTQLLMGLCAGEREEKPFTALFRNWNDRSFLAFDKPLHAQALGLRLVAMTEEDKKAQKKAVQHTIFSALRAGRNEPRQLTVDELTAQVRKSSVKQLAARDADLAGLMMPESGINAPYYGAFAYSVRAGNFEALQYYINKIGRVDTVFNLTPALQTTMLYYLFTINLSKDKGLDPDFLLKATRFICEHPTFIPSQTNSGSQTTPLHVAASTLNTAECINYMINTPHDATQKKANPCALDANERFPFYTALFASWNKEKPLQFKAVLRTFLECPDFAEHALGLYTNMQSVLVNIPLQARRAINFILTEIFLENAQFLINAATSRGFNIVPLLIKENASVYLHLLISQYGNDGKRLVQLEDFKKPLKITPNTDPESHKNALAFALDHWSQTNPRDVRIKNLHTTDLNFLLCGAISYQDYAQGFSVGDREKYDIIYDGYRFSPGQKTTETDFEAVAAAQFAAFLAEEQANA